MDYALGARLGSVPVVGSVVRRLGLFETDWDSAIFLHDLTKPFPWASGSVDAIYSSHTLEHLSRADGEAFLAECARCLKVGGRLRIVVPDLAVIVERYQSGVVAAPDFVESLGVLYDLKGGQLKSKASIFTQFPHKCMYDELSLLKAFRDAGLESKSRQAFDSDISAIVEIELADRTTEGLIVEGVKL